MNFAVNFHRTSCAFEANKKLLTLSEYKVRNECDNRYFLTENCTVKSLLGVHLRHLPNVPVKRGYLPKGT